MQMKHVMKETVDGGMVGAKTKGQHIWLAQTSYYTTVGYGSLAPPLRYTTICKNTRI